MTHIQQAHTYPLPWHKANQDSQEGIRLNYSKGKGKNI